MIRFGIIGAGRNAAGNARRLAQYEDRCKIVGVADPVSDAASALASEHAAKAYGDFREMLDDVDAVVISSPNFLHASQAIECAEAGKHIFCEKPMALNAEEAEQMVAAAEGNGVKTFVGFSVRFGGVKQTMMEYLREERLGTIIGAWSRRLSFWAPKAGSSWRSDIEKCGGIISELIVHEIDWMVALLGKPETVYARKRSRQTEHPRENDHVWISMTMPHEVTGTIEGSTMSPMPDYYSGITGTKGSLFTNKWGQELYYQNAGDREAEQIDAGEDFEKTGHFLDVIEGKAESVADFRYGAMITRIADQTINSALQNKVLPV